MNSTPIKIGAPKNYPFADGWVTRPWCFSALKLL